MENGISGEQVITASAGNTGNAGQNEKEPTTGPRSIEQDFPRAAAALRDVGYGESARRQKLQEAANEGLSDDEITALAAPLPLQVASPIQAYVRNRLLSIKYELTHWWRHRTPLSLLINAVGWGGALIGPSIHFGFTWISGIGIGVVVLLRLRNTVSEFSPKHMPVLKQNHGERQLRLEKQIHRLQQWKLAGPTPREIEDFQIDALGLITSYVRDHRSDLHGRQIFVNLLVRSGPDEVIVVARSNSQRPLARTYSASECSVCWSVFETAGVQFTGDLYAEHPNTPDGKRYHSILALPVKLNGRVLGVVSIDSEARHHFDNCYRNLATELAPFVQLLAATLEPRTLEKVARAIGSEELATLSRDLDPSIAARLRQKMAPKKLSKNRKKSRKR